MFDKYKTIKLCSIAADAFFCFSTAKRIKIYDNFIFLLENSSNVFIIHRFDFDGNFISSWKIQLSDALLIDFIYLNGFIYIYFLQSISENNEKVIIYKSLSTGFQFIEDIPRESYKHDMDFFNMFIHKDECRFLVIKNDKVVLYKVEDNLTILKSLNGAKWVISGTYVVNIDGINWSLYNSDLELINSFEFEDDIDWLGIAVNERKGIIAMATDNSDNDTGGLYIYDMNNKQYVTYYQRYGFFNIAVIYDNIWTSIASSYTNVGGMMVFDKITNLKFALLRDEYEISKPGMSKPLLYQALGFYELNNNKALLADSNKIIVADTSLRVLQELNNVEYDSFILSEDKNMLITLYLKEHNGMENHMRYDAFISMYQWNPNQINTQIIELSHFR